MWYNVNFILLHLISTFWILLLKIFLTCRMPLAHLLNIIKPYMWGFSELWLFIDFIVIRKLAFLSGARSDLESCDSPHCFFGKHWNSCPLTAVTRSSLGLLIPATFKMNHITFSCFVSGLMTFDWIMATRNTHCKDPWFCDILLNSGWLDSPGIFPCGDHCSSCCSVRF